MGKKYFIALIVTVSGIANMASARQSDSSHLSTDSTAVFQYWLVSLQDSVDMSDPVDPLKTTFSNYIDDRFSTPIFTPEDDLTSKMPQFKPPKVDEQMIIPQFKKCPDQKRPLQKKRDG